MMLGLFSKKCPRCGGKLQFVSGTVGHKPYRCPNCIRSAKLENTIREIERDISYNRATVDFYKR